MKWISVKDRLPSEGEVVDVWIGVYKERWTNYLYVRDYKGQKGNDFFDPVSSGLCCIRNASHWMPVPKPPESE